MPVHTEPYLNRELSWLNFNRRVLEEGTNRAHPLLERLRFLSISGSNMDEFFMVRVAGLKGHQLQGVEELSADGRTATQQLDAIVGYTDELMEAQQDVWDSLRAQLSHSGIFIIEESDLDPAAEGWLDTYFHEQILPVLAPQALDCAHPFPFIQNKGLAILFDMVLPPKGQAIRELVMLPPTLPRFVRLPGERARFIPMEAVVRRRCEKLFPGHEILATGAFRVLRDSEIEVAEEGEDLVHHFRSAIKRRRRGRVIRLEFQKGMPERLETLVRDGLHGESALVSESRGFLGIADVAELTDEDRPDLKFDPFTARFPERVREHGGDCFAAIRAKDFVIHHPYESFDVVVEFLKQAAADPQVVAIRQTLYRAGKQSPIVRALIDAAESGKSVTAVIELKARFDEEQNLDWAAELERAGAQVVYGFVTWKTHAKASLVIRKEECGYRTYCHLGTGNYHPVTAKIYTDLSFFTADPRVGSDVGKLFNYITAYVEPKELELLAMSPHGLREKLVGLIDAEIANARDGKPAAIWAKLNALVDRHIIDKLYEASSAGVQIDLIVRGICCLRPGVAGLSENIRVKSIVGRFLEHGRVLAFANGDPLPSRRAHVFLSSADWMPRNLNRRVEFLLKVENPTVHQQLLDQVLVACLLDDEQSWRLLPDGSYERLRSNGETSFNLHRYFMTNPSLSGRGAAHGEDVRALHLRATTESGRSGGSAAGDEPGAVQSVA